MKVSDQDTQIWVLYDFNQGMTVGSLSEKYNLPRSEIVKIISNQDPVAPPKNKNKPIKRTVKVKLTPEIAAKIHANKGDFKVKDAIKLIVLDYLEYHFSDSNPY